MVILDEFRVTLFKCDGRVIVWPQENERYHPACIQLTRPQNRIGLMFIELISPQYLRRLYTSLRRRIGAWAKQGVTLLNTNYFNEMHPFDNWK